MARMEETEWTFSLACWSFATTWIVSIPFDGETGRKGLHTAGSPSSSCAVPRLPPWEQLLLLRTWPTARAGQALQEDPRGARTYSVSESSMSDTAGTTLSTGVHAGLMQERPRWMTSCTYLGNNCVSEPHRSGAGPPPHSKVTTG